MAREIFEKAGLDPDENLLNHDIKSFYTNVPLNKAIALRRLYELTNPPEMSRKTIKKTFKFGSD